MNSRPADSLRRQVAELLVVRASGHLNDQQRRYPQWELPNSELQRLLRNGVGGVILLGGSAVELQQRTQQLQGWSEQRLLFCADVEEGVAVRCLEAPTAGSDAAGRSDDHWPAPPAVPLRGAAGC